VLSDTRQEPRRADPSAEPDPDEKEST